MLSSRLRGASLIVAALLFAAVAQGQSLNRASRPARLAGMTGHTPQAQAAALKTETILHNFQVNGVDGGTPQGGLVFDVAGNLYGTTAGGGANFKGSIFELSPPEVAGGAWTEQVLYSFIGGVGGPGQAPGGTLLIDGKGNLYGTAGAPGPGGVVFELSPLGGGSWNYQVLYTFCSILGGSNCEDGNTPVASLIMDAQGNLYGVTQNGGATNNGTVFELTPTASVPWTEKVLWSFCPSTAPCNTDGARPEASLIFDSKGNLYGTTIDGGSASDLGVVFELSPPATAGGAWTEQVLHVFGGSLFDGSIPMGNLVLDGKGNLYGTTETSENVLITPPGDGGVVFELSPPVAPSTTWTETILHYFTGAPTTASTDGAAPESGLIFDALGNLYGTTLWGGPNIDTQQGTTAGTVYEMSPPAKAGGAWTINYLYYFGATSTDGFETAAGVIFDSLGNLYGTTQAGGANNAGTAFELSSPVVKLTPTVVVNPAATSITTAQSLEVTITVSGGSGNPTPTGTVTLTSGSYNSGAMALSGGSAMIVIPAGSLALGVDTLTASYSGDSSYNSALGNKSVTVTTPPPAPTISSLSPFVAVAGGTGFVLTVNGANFFSGATVTWGETALVTTFVTSVKLTATVPAGLIAAAGSAEVTVTSSGGTSEPAEFTITPNGTLPLILSLAPTSALAGGTGIPSLVVNGGNFTNKSVVLWNGAVRTTSFVSSTELTAIISATDVAAQGTALVTVANAPPVAGTSMAQPVAVMIAPSAAVATIKGATLAVAADGGGNHVMTLTGSNFLPSSVVQWNGAGLPTTYVSPWQISALVSTPDIEALPVVVTVENPGGISGGFEAE